MSTSNFDLKRIYSFSDCFGGESNPFRAPDPDALISTDFRSHPLDERHREFDIWGREGITDHVLRTILRLHEEVDRCAVLNEGQKKRLVGGTGVLVNGAPRIQAHNNGEPFHLAQLRAGQVRVVAPLHALSAVRNQIFRLQRLPNEGNPLFSAREQFRSSFAAWLLRADHNVPLEEVDPQEIPEAPKDWKVSYVDRFGNIVTFDNREREPEQKTLDELRNEFRLRIWKTVLPVALGSCLKEADSGVLTIYENDRNIEVIRKWEPDETVATRRKLSAYSQFGKPFIGAPVRIEP